MKLKKTIFVALAAFMLVGTAIPAMAAQDGFSGYTQEQLRDLEALGVDDEGIPMALSENPFADDLGFDEDGIPIVIAPAPTELYSVEINGEATEIKAVVVVPLRAVAEKLGFAVTWNPSGAITVDDGTMYGDITIGEDTYYVVNHADDMASMSAPFSLGLAPYVVNGTTYVPVEYFNALLGQEGAVNLENGTVIINTKHENIQIPNPYVSCADLNEAAAKVGFSLVVPSTPDCISVIDGNMIQADYKNGMCIRKAAGAEDISGDYNSYTQVKAMEGVTLKGSENGFSLAIWAKDGCTYSVSVETPLPQAALLALVADVQ